MPPTPGNLRTSPPRLARIVPRERLFRRLDRARRHPVVWIQAPAGAGKTALVASWIAERGHAALWLTLASGDDAASVLSTIAAATRSGSRERAFPPFRPEHAGAPGAYAAQLFSRLGSMGRRRPDVIVLDDYHEVGAASLLHDAMRDGAAGLPEGLTLVVVSRQGPPPALARLRASGAIEAVEPAELTVTAAEARAIARLRAPRRTLSPATLRAAQGWAAGIVLLAGAGDHGREAEREARRHVFDYFAAEVFDRSPARVQRVLLRTSVLPAVSEAHAARLTGDAHAGDVLADLARGGWFTERLGGTPPTYRFHALFREFLLARARQALDADAWADLARAAAGLLADDGDVDGALTLLADAGAPDALARMLVQRAPALLAAGRFESVSRWIDRLAPEAVERHPWLGLFSGIARFHRDPAAAIAAIDRAHGAFLEAGDAAGAFRSWAAATDLQFVALDDVSSIGPRLDVLDRLRARFDAYPDPETEGLVVAAAVGAFGNVRANDARLRGWEDRALELALSPGDPRLRLHVGRQLVLHLAYWRADVVRSRIVLDTLGPVAAAVADPTEAVIWHLAEAITHDHAGDGARARRAADRGLDVAARAGVHLWDRLLWAERLFAALEAEDFDAAARDLAALSARAEAAPRLALFATQYAAAAVAYRRGEHREAVERVRAAARLAVEASHPMTQAVAQLVWAAASSRGGGRGPTLDEAAHVARETGFGYGAIAAHLLAASNALSRGDDDEAARRLALALPEARGLGCTNVVTVGRGDMAELCALALERRIEPEFACHVVTTRRLAPGPRARAVAAWPWTVRVESVGGLRIVRQGAKPPRKAQKKPLELLKLLVAHGERGAPAASVAERLWPDADGDAAQHALETTAYRLRRLLGDPLSIVQRGGRVALDPGRVFVDAWAVERLADRVADADRAGEVERAGDLAAAALELGDGELFGDDADPDLAAARQRFARRVGAVRRARG